jgi:PPOX class probable FMN-dependent enzyme
MTPGNSGPSGSQPRFSRLNLEQIQAVLGLPDKEVEEKVWPEIGLTARRFIAHSPIVFLATSSDTGGDCSPRGDSPGFVRVLDERTLALPDRTGNNLADSFRNILRNPSLGMLFLVPGLRETLRVNGRAYITDDADLLARFPFDLRPPKLALIVEVEEVYFHCGKALIRSRLWDSEQSALGEAALGGINAFSLQLVEANKVTETSAEFGSTLEQKYIHEI